MLAISVKKSQVKAKEVLSSLLTQFEFAKVWPKASDWPPERLNDGALYSPITKERKKLLKKKLGYYFQDFQTTNVKGDNYYFPENTLFETQYWYNFYEFKVKLYKLQKEAWALTEEDETQLTQEEKSKLGEVRQWLDKAWEEYSARDTQYRQAVDSLRSRYVWINESLTYDEVAYCD